MFGFFKYIKSWFVSEIEESVEDLMKKYITSKILFAKSKGWIGPLRKEISFLNSIGLLSCDTKTLSERDVVYKPDVLSVGKFSIPWDYQFDTATTFIRNGGDCNSLNRVCQVFKYMETGAAYLVTYVAHDPKKNHTTCIYYSKVNNKWFGFDYGKETKGFDTFKETLDQIAGKYKVDVLNYVAQDINWEFVNL